MWNLDASRMNYVSSHTHNQELNTEKKEKVTEDFTAISILLGIRTNAATSYTLSLSESYTTHHAKRSYFVSIL